LGGLGLVALTGAQWVDPAAALVVACLLAITGYRLVRESVGGLLDEESDEIVRTILRLIGKDRPAGIIQIHHLRVMRSGAYHHIDAHAVVPEYWDVREAHAYTDAFEDALMQQYPYAGELHLHLDPCRRAYCRFCDVTECPIRVEKFERKREIDFDELTSPQEPRHFRSKSQHGRNAVKS
jgi:divalent metal cation (Fe/Co/Zn/Cd) transporter